MTVPSSWQRAGRVGAPALAAALARLHWDPLTGTNDFLAVIAFHDPLLHAAIVAWYYLAPAAAVALGLSAAMSVFHVWPAGAGAGRGKGELPDWPTSAADERLRVVIGECHHPVERQPAPDPGWLVIPDEGLYTGIAIFGAVGTGKTSACMYPFARQILSWQAGDPARKAGALVLEVKGDFCFKVREILEKAKRAGDYVELGIERRHVLQWNPLDAPWMDSYSLAYRLSGLINQLFGKGKDPFWQLAYTNLLRWVISLHRIERGWVTLRDLYLCAIRPERLAAVIDEAEAYCARIGQPLLTLPVAALAGRPLAVLAGRAAWEPLEGAEGRVAAPAARELHRAVVESGLGAAAGQAETMDEDEVRRKRQTLEAVQTWYEADWLALDQKLRTSIVESVSVFLGLFEEPDIRRIFCPERPPPAPGERLAGGGPPDPKVLRPLPPIAELIEEGRVIALNMPAGANPALARTVGVMLKQSWLQALLLRPARGGDFRPSAFICDEYQEFATVGGDDPGGDEKSFALTRQARCIPIVATQSISSIRSVVQGREAWRTLLQALRTKIFLSLSDESSAKLASEMCGQVPRMKASVSFNESSSRAGVSLLSGRAGGARPTMGMSKSWSERREALFHPRDFALLGTAEAVVLPFDGKRSLPARRVYLKPYYLDRELGFFEARERGQL